MKKAYVFMADGFEEGECLVTADLMRRGGSDAVLVSVTGKYEVETANYDILIASSVSDVKLSQTIRILGTEAPAPYGELPAYESG